MNNKKSTKRALLSSVLSLVLCMAMLVGTTFAWFTDSVTSNGNIIKSGTLKVTMDWAEGDENPDEATWNDASKGAIFNSQLWEPGYTEAKHIKIANVGTLALKYQLRILANGVVSELADVIDVYYFAEATQLTRANIANATKLGTLSEVLNNTNENAISKTIAGELTAGTEKTVTIALKMQESAGNEYQNLSIGTDFSIQLIATQLTSETDSFDNQYDAKADFAPQEVPAAMVSALTDDEISTEATGLEWNLDAGYQFEPTETEEQAKESEYRWYHVDFEVSADQPVKEGSLALAGYYSAWCDAINEGNWYGFTVPSVEANTPVRLLNGVVNVNYMEICEYGNDGKGFQCGIVDLSEDGSNAGTTVTVKLNMYEVENADAPADVSGTKPNVEVADAEPITIGTFTYTFPAKEVSGQAELTAAIANGASAVQLGAGTYTIPTQVAGKEVTITGSGDSTVIDFTKVNTATNASITFENVKFQGKNENVMNGFGIQGTSGHIAYKNCTFDGAVTNEYYGTVSYQDCIFTGTGYITTYAVSSATFENCVFDKADSRAILVYSHGDNPVKVTIKDCEFKAAAKATTYAGDWTAAIEVDTTNIKTAGTTVTVANCKYDDNYSGLVRDKSATGSTPAVITVDGVTK